MGKQLKPLINENENIPHPDNFCGGNFQDWIEVNLIEKCNGKCSWCVEKYGWHPTEHVPWYKLYDAIISTNKTNVILLGGEPTLFEMLPYLIWSLHLAGKRVYITTNGSRLTDIWVRNNLKGIYGVNISIHHYDLKKNAEITGINLDQEELAEAIRAIHSLGGRVRINCNCIAGYIDSHDEIRKFISFIYAIHGDSARFAELKFDNENFVDLAKILEYNFGLNDDPFKCGCNKNATIDGMQVNFRQMCGLQTCKRPKPDNPIQHKKQVLYYDGKIYDGWQIQKRGNIMKSDSEKIVQILEKVAEGKMKVAIAAAEIASIKSSNTVIERIVAAPTSDGCRY